MASSPNALACVTTLCRANSTSRASVLLTPPVNNIYIYGQATPPDTQVTAGHTPRQSGDCWPHPQTVQVTAGHIPRHSGDCWPHPRQSGDCWPHPRQSGDCWPHPRQSGNSGHTPRQAGDCWPHPQTLR